MYPVTGLPATSAGAAQETVAPAATADAVGVAGAGGVNALNELTTL